MLCSPFLMGDGLDTVSCIQDALTRAEASIALWADLFIPKSDRSEILNTDNARHGMWLQLSALGYTLSAINDALDTLKIAPPQNG